MQHSRGPREAEVFYRLPGRNEGISLGSAMSRCHKNSRPFLRFFFLKLLASVCAIMMLGAALRGRPALIEGPAVSSLYRGASSIEKTNLVIQDPLVHAAQATKGAYPGYPMCNGRLAWLRANWNTTEDRKAFYSAAGVTGDENSFLNFLNQNG